MLDIPQTKVWGVLIGDTEEGTHYVCFTTCGKNRVGNRFHARVMMSVKREHTHLRCQFDLRAVERPLSFHGHPAPAYSTSVRLYDYPSLSPRVTLDGTTVLHNDEKELLYEKRTEAHTDPALTGGTAHGAVCV
jgi:hypothetical protein